MKLPHIHHHPIPQHIHGPIQLHGHGMVRDEAGGGVAVHWWRGLHTINILIAAHLMEESSKKVLKIIVILSSVGTSVCAQGDLPRPLIEPEQEHGDDVLLILLPDSPFPHQPDHLVPGMSVQGKAVHIQPELHNPGPPGPDGAVAVQVVDGGDHDGEVLVDVLLCL